MNSQNEHFLFVKSARRMRLLKSSFSVWQESLTQIFRTQKATTSHAEGPLSFAVWQGLPLVSH